MLITQSEYEDFEGIARALPTSDEERILVHHIGNIWVWTEGHNADYRWGEVEFGVVLALGRESYGDCSTAVLAGLVQAMSAVGAAR